MLPRCLSRVSGLPELEHGAYTASTVFSNDSPKASPFSTTFMVKTRVLPEAL